MEMEHLSLANKIFADTRIKMDMGLDTLIRALVEKELGVGSVTLKIKVEMETKVTDDGEVFYEPKFEPKVNIRVAAKGDLDCFVPKGLVMKRTRGGEFLACENQISMEEMLKEQKGA
jgi:hypothetical protein